MDERGACPDPFTPTGAMAPALAKADSNLVADPRGGTTCEVPSGDSAIRSCDFGSLDKPGRTIAMLGDSHALQFSAPMAQIAEKIGWHVITFFKSACSGTGDHDVLLATRPEDQDACATWGEAAIDAIVDSKAIDTVVFSNLRNVYSEDGGGRPISAKAYTAVWDRFVAAGKEVVVIADIPGTIGSDIPDCIEAAGANPSVCNSPQSTAVGTDVMAASAIAYNDSMVRVVDLTDKFCRDGVCHVIIGGAIVYSDAGHLTTTYATSLAPYLELALLR